MKNNPLPETAMRAALESAGLSAQQVQARLQIALTVNRLQAEGVPAEVIRAELRYAEERLSEGHSIIAATSGHGCSAPAQPPEGDAAGQNTAANDGQQCAAHPSPVERDAAGQTLGAADDSGLSGRARASHQDRDGGHRSAAGNGQTNDAPAREPATPKRDARGIESIAGVQSTLAKSVFDTYKLPDGRPIGQVRWGELVRLARTYATASRLLALIDEYGQADPDARVDEVLSESSLKDFIRIAELRNAA